MFGDGDGLGAEDEFAGDRLRDGIGWGSEKSWEGRCIGEGEGLGKEKGLGEGDGFRAGGRI